MVGPIWSDQFYRPFNGLSNPLDGFALPVGPKFKPLPPGSDGSAMAQELACPICDADVPLSGDEKPGQEVYCAYCRAPLTVKRGSDEDDLELEEDD